jgi:cation/acetate symporter
MTVLAASVNGLALTLFIVLVVVTLGVTLVAARRTRGVADFWAAGGRISRTQNGLAIAGEYTSASAFLGITGLIFLVGFDGFLYSIATTVGLVGLLLVLAERLRNAGRYTLGDVLAARLDARPVRAAAALSTLAIAGAYLVTQLVGAGAVVQALIGIDARWAIVLSAVVMLAYVGAGGMLATTWVLVLKTGLLLVISLGLAVLVLGRVGFDPAELVRRAAAKHPAGDAYLQPGLAFDGWNTVSLCVSLTLGALGSPYLLMRFFTVRDAPTARRSMTLAIGVIGGFMLLTPVLGLGARALLDPAGQAMAGPSGNLAVAALAQKLGGGAGSAGGDLLLAIVAAGAFAVIVGFVAGVMMAAAGAVAHDLWQGVVRRDRAADREELLVARVASVALAVVAVVVAILAQNLNLAFLGGLVFAIAASANFPVLLLSMTWPRLTTRGAVCGMLVGLLSAIALAIMSPAVWPGPDSHGSPFGLNQPGIVSIPLGFLGCVVGSLLSRPEPLERWTELHVRAESGLGAVTTS